MYGLMLGLPAGFVYGLVLGLSGGLTYGIMFELVEPLNDAQPTDPRHPVRDDLAYGLAVGLIFGLMLGLMAGLLDRLEVGVSTGYAFELALKIAFALACGMLVGLYWISGAGRRYLVFLFCIRGRLPWHLGTFLNWAYEAGLLRISGVAYQFRHRELQDWLTAHPTP
ncbi:hypothetical protein [Streptomyces sp. NPDC059215]|uniref:hypothetical protein n=1 Tax=Streptomyces sp. NPDC059215 TaxID=3346772 RepID=UPI0036C388D4